MKQEDEVLQTFESIKKSLMSNDTESIKKLYASDYRNYNIRGGVEYLDSVLDAYQPGGVVLEKFENKDLRVEVIGDIGIISGTGYISGKFQEFTFEHNLRFLDIYIKRDSNWQYYISQATEILSE